jgi:hypothetical protein
VEWGKMSNLINLKNKLEKRNKILHKVEFGDEVVFEIRNNFFIGGIFQDVLNEDQINRMQKAKTEKAKGKILKEVDLQSVFSALEKAIFNTYTIEEYKDKIEQITASNKDLKTVLNDLLEHYSIEQIYEEQLGYKNVENLMYYKNVLEAVLDKDDKKK